MPKKTKNKVPFYLKPFEKVLTQCTDLTLSYLYDYSCTYYNEICSYSDWLAKVHKFMNNDKECDK